MVLYGESEELNRVVVLTLARAIHINGLEQQSIPWVKEVLSNIMNKTPHSWPSHTLKCFPAILQDFYNDNPGMPQFITGHILTLETSRFYFLIKTFAHLSLRYFSFYFLGPKENKAQLNKTVEDEYKTWSSMSNEHDIVQVFLISFRNLSTYCLEE
jgi:mediator of RNA polymerase II transcription subunit 23